MAVYPFWTGGTTVLPSYATSMSIFRFLSPNANLMFLNKVLHGILTISFYFITHFALAGAALTGLCVVSSKII